MKRATLNPDLLEYVHGLRDVLSPDASDGEIIGAVEDYLERTGTIPEQMEKLLLWEYQWGDGETVGRNNPWRYE